jgi:hypothetical protein
MTWDEHYRLWKEVLDKPGQEAHLRMQAARKRVSKNSQDDWLWLKESLSDPERKGFVALVFKFQPVPKRLVPSMLLAGVLTKNLSFNRWFIEPCVRSFGSRRVLEELLRYFDSGTNVEKAGAASAFYWVGGNPRNEELDDVILSIRCRMLREFVDNADLQVRRRIIPMLTLKSKDYPEEYRSLVPIAVDIARSHPDEYIRHRVESGWSWRIRPRKNKRSKRTAIE